MLRRLLGSIGYERKSTLAAPSADLRWLFAGGAPTAAGKPVTAETAVRCTAVAAAVRSIADPISSMPVHVYRRGENGARERDTSHPAYALLHDQANPWASAGDFREQLQSDALLHGNGYGIVVRVDGKPRELHRMDPRGAKVTLTHDGPAYEFGVGDQRRTYAYADVIHIRAPISHDGVTGQSPVHLAREAIGLALVMEEHGARLFGSGARPSGVLERPATLSPEAAKALGEAWHESQGGSANSGRTPVLYEGMKFNPLTFNSVDAQFLELRKYAVDEIARAFGVPPHMLYELGRATWGNAEEMGQAFVTFTLLPWIKRWEGAIARALFTPEERASYFAEFLVDDFLRADFAKRSEGYAKLIAARVLNPNEARAMEGRPPYEGGDVFANPNVATPANDNQQASEPAA